MELLNIRLIKLDATRRLKNNLPRAISLVFAMLLIIIALSTSRKLIDIFIRSFGVDTMVTSNLSLSMLIAMILSFVLSITVLMPIWMNIKKWYMNLNSDGVPIKATLSLISSPRVYLKIVLYAVIKAVFMVVTTLILLTPSILLGSVAKSQYDLNNGGDGALFITLVVLTVIFAIISIFYGIYIFLGFFYADYIYISRIEQNPLKAIVLSLKIAKSSRFKLVTVFFSLLPYVLVSVFIIPLIFTIPIMQSTYACFAKQQLGLYLYEQSQS